MAKTQASLPEVIEGKSSGARSPTVPRARITIKALCMHIYPLSRLIGAPAASWEKLIVELEEKENIAYRYYQPAREAIVELTSRAGKRRDAILERMLAQSANVIHTVMQDPVTDNRRAFESFEDNFFPKITAFSKSLLRVPQVEGTFFSGIILKGLPHMIVTDDKGRERYVFIYPSAWKKHELDAYMELLTIIVESEFGADAADIWCMGLRDGKTVQWKKSKTRTRAACRAAAKLLKRMADAGVLDL